LEKVSARPARGQRESESGERGRSTNPAENNAAPDFNQNSKFQIKENTRRSGAQTGEYSLGVSL